MVLIGKKSGSLFVAPVRRSPYSSMEVSRFDGDRSVMLNKTILVSKNKVYSKNQFKNTQNDFLTKNEKVRLKKKVLDYFK